MSHFRKIFLSPIFPEDEELTRIARVTNVLLHVLIVGLAAETVADITVFVNKLPAFLLILVCLIVVIISMSILHHNQVRLASLILLVGLWIIVFVSFLTSGGPGTSNSALLYLPTVYAALMFGKKTAIGTTILSTFASLGIVLWDFSGHPLPTIFPVPIFSGWVSLAIGLFLITVTIIMSVDSFQKAIKSAHEQLAERNKVEAALRTSEHKYAQITQNIPGMVFQVQVLNNGSFKFNYVSPTGLQLLELPENIADSWKPGDLVIEEDRKAFIETFQEAISHQIAWRSEFKLLTKNGQIRWFLGTASPSMEGENLLYNGLLMDITDRKKIEENLRQSEEKYRSIFENAIEGIYQSTPEGRFISVNPASVRMFGFESAAEMINSITNIGQQIYAHPEDRDKLIEILNKNGFVENYEVENLRKNGQPMWVSLNLHIVRDSIGNVLHYQGAALDITEHKQAEQALVKSQIQLDSIIQSTSDMIWSVNSENFGLLTFNHRLSDYFLTGRDMVISSGMRPEDLLSTRDLAQFWRTGYQRALDEGPFTIEYQTSASPQILLLGFNVLKHNNVAFGVSVFGKDITERKRAEAEVTRLNYLLQDRVDARTHELNTLSRVMTLSIQSPTVEALAETILKAVLETPGYPAGMIHLFPEPNPDGETTAPFPTLYLKASQNLPADLIPCYQAVSLDDKLVGEVARIKKRLILNYPADITQNCAFPLSFRCYIGAPIFVQEEVRGVLSVFSLPTQKPGGEFSSFLNTIADIVGGAIDNIDLHYQAERAAILEERQRLARDLHDSVSQTLFSASALAETLPLIWEQDPLKGKEYMNSLSRLTRAALAEMRSLLVELRPQALLKADLGDLIRQLALGFAGHTRAEVNVEISGKAILAADVQTTFFRIAQETLHNIIKHAHASRVSIQFDLDPQHAWLRVEDNGRGFDPDQLNAQRFGLRIMQERAALGGTQLELDSQPGSGTRVSLKWVQTTRQFDAPVPSGINRDIL